jgi:predicted dehydrogenase
MTAKKAETQIRFALIGCGRISQTHLQAIEVLKDHCNLKAVVDVREDAAKSVANQYGCAAYTDYRRVIDGDQVDAVIISTPPNTHAEIATYFLENKKPVLCEKPLATTVSDAKTMVNKAAEHNVLLMMASKYRYVADTIKAKGIVESGILGDIILFENVFCGKVDMRDRWNARKELGGGGVIVDNGCHSVDIARFLLGPIEKVQAAEGKRVQKLGVEDTARIHFRTKSDAMGMVDLSWSIQKERDSYIEIFGTEGVLSIGWQCSKYRQSEKMNWVTFGKGYNKVDAFSSQIRNFVQSIKGKEMPLITAEDALESVKVIEAAYKSVEMNTWVDVG